jgi:hypothetical protein
VIEAVCGTSVPDVWDVLEVVVGTEVEVVDRAAGEVVVRVTVVVVEELVEDGLLEQAASAKAQAGRIDRRIDHVRSALGMAGVYDRARRNGGSPRDPGDQARVGTVPITDARSMERRWGQ